LHWGESLPRLCNCTLTAPTHSWHRFLPFNTWPVQVPLARKSSLHTRRNNGHEKLLNGISMSRRLPILPDYEWQSGGSSIASSRAPPPGAVPRRGATFPLTSNGSYAPSRDPTAWNEASGLPAGWVLPDPRRQPRPYRQVNFPSTEVRTQRVMISAGGLLLAREVRVRVLVINTVQSTTAAPTHRVRTQRIANPGIVRKHLAVMPLRPGPGPKVIVAVAPLNAKPATPAGRVSAAADPRLRTVFR
jgi:hypothetical protein